MQGEARRTSGTYHLTTEVKKGGPVKILVLGGTGGFGSIICRQLRDEHHVVVAAGRDQAKGSKFVRDNPDIDFMQIDREHITPQDLIGFHILVDAAGPFRGQGRHPARMAIAAGIDHLDIADDRGYVLGVGELDAKARAAGVRILSGCSSVPALSGAIAAELADGMEAVHLVEIAISASSQAAFGRSVLHSMLSSAGRPIARSDGSRGVAMTDPRRLRVAHDGRDAIDRIVLEVDGPDQDLLTNGLPGRPAVRFRAGGELGMHNMAMRLVARLVQSGILRNGASLLHLAGLARRITGSMGDGRSAMEVRLTGKTGGRRVTRVRSLIAERNMGPRIPCLIVPAIVQAIAEGRVEPGARPGIGVIGVRETLARMPTGSISIETSENDDTPLYARAMPGYSRLAPALQAMHDVPAITHASGMARIRTGASPIAWIIGRMFGFPPAGDKVPVTVDFERMGNEEQWTRDFGGHRFSSILSQVDGGVEERFGPLSFRFRLEDHDGSLRMTPVGWRMGRLRLPRMLMMDGVATERSENGVFTFDVPIRLPFIGLVIHYSGWLQPG